MMFEGLKRMIARRRVSPEIQPEVRLVRFGNVTVGVNIHRPEEMLKISTVWRCVSLIGNALGTLPWDVMRESAKGELTRVPMHPIAKIMGRTPNTDMTPLSLMATINSHKLLYGNFYGEIEFRGNGQAAALWPIAPDRVDPWRDENGELFFRVAQPRGGIIDMPQERIFHVPGLAWDGIRGYSILEVGMQSLGAAYAMDRFAGGFFARGMMPGGVLEIPEGIDLDKDAMDNLRSELERTQAGWQAGQAPLILDQGIKYNPTQYEPDKSQFLDTRKFTVFDICRWFGVPPYLAFASDEEPRANVETQSREFLMYGLDPHVVALQQEADRKMFAGLPANLTTKMNTDEFTRGDLTARGEFYTKLRHLGVYTVNDILRLESQETIGSEGDVRVMQVQFQPIGKDGAPTNPNPPPAPAPGVSGEPGAIPPNPATTNGTGKTNGVAV